MSSSNSPAPPPPPPPPAAAAAAAAAAPPAAVSSSSSSSSKNQQPRKKRQRIIEESPPPPPPPLPLPKVVVDFEDALSKLVTRSTNAGRAGFPKEYPRDPETLANDDGGGMMLTDPDNAKYMTASRRWADALGIFVNNKNKKKQFPLVVHVAGTKGKGSTCAMVESILRAHNLKTGLYTSPHLTSVRERFRLNGQLVSSSLLSEHWRKVEESMKWENVEEPLPGHYFRFLTMVGYSLFVHCNVDVMVLETGLGGRLDPTNIVPSERVAATGVTLLGLDHCDILGDTLTLIGREKGGIWKRGVPAWTISGQAEEGLAALRACAQHQDVHLQLAEELPAGSCTIGLAGAHQRVNAGLAVQLAATCLSRMWQENEHNTEPPPVFSIDSPKVVAGLANVQWPGRCQEFAVSPNMTWYLDSAHTVESMQACADWFASVATPQVGSKTRYILVSNLGHTRDPFDLYAPIAGLGVYFDQVYVAPFDWDRTRSSAPRSFQELAALHPEIEIGGDDDSSLAAPTDDSPLAWQRVLLRILRVLLLRSSNNDKLEGCINNLPTTTFTACDSTSQAVDCILTEHNNNNNNKAAGGGGGGGGGGDGNDIHTRVLCTGSPYTTASALSALGWSPV